MSVCVALESGESACSDETTPMHETPHAVYETTDRGHFRSAFTRALAWLDGDLMATGYSMVELIFDGATRARWGSECMHDSR